MITRLTRMQSSWLAALAIIGFAVTPVVAQTVVLNEIARVDVSAEFNSTTANGSNPAAVAWDGTNLFVAGFNNSGVDGSVGIVRYDNALTSAVVGPQFAQLAGTPNARGYSGLDISGGSLAAAYDDGGADANGLQAFDLAGSQNWAKNIRGGSGVAFDPGFASPVEGGTDGSGVAWTTFGSGRRALQNTPDGADIYTTGNGMIITPDFQGSFWRDMDFDDQGNLVARRSNDLTKLTRTGANSGTTGFIVDNDENGPLVNGQNVAFMYGIDADSDSWVLWNDRASAGTGQAATDVLKVSRFDGTAGTLAINLLGARGPGGGGLPDGNGYYDFSWDADSDQLALLDFSSRTVHIFSVVPEPASGVLLLIGLAFACRKRKS